MRRYDEPIEVKAGLVAGQEGPAQFLWRNRLWSVREIESRWLETGDWWDGPAARAVRGELDDPTDSEPYDSHRPGPDRAGPDRPRADHAGRAGAGPTSAGSDRAAPYRPGPDRAGRTRPRRSGRDRPTDDPGGEHEVWRVVAAPGRSAEQGVCELAYASSTGRWRLRTVLD